MSITRKKWENACDQHRITISTLIKNQCHKLCTVIGQLSPPPRQSPPTVSQPVAVKCVAHWKPSCKLLQNCDILVDYRRETPQFHTCLQCTNSHVNLIHKLIQFPINFLLDWALFHGKYVCLSPAVCLSIDTSREVVCSGKTVRLNKMKLHRVIDICWEQIVFGLGVWYPRV